MDFPELVFKVANQYSCLDLAVFQISESGRERTVTVDLEIDGAQPSSSSQRRGKQRREGQRGESTSRRRSSAARAVVNGGGLGLRLGTSGMAGGGLQRRHGSAAEQLMLELHYGGFWEERDMGWPCSAKGW